jgi:hypothetical protein
MTAQEALRLDIKIARLAAEYATTKNADEKGRLMVTIRQLSGLRDHGTDRGLGPIEPRTRLAEGHFAAVGPCNRKSAT